MSRRMPRAAVGAGAALLALMLLSACAPEPVELRAEAEDVFDDVVGAASEVPVTVLRSLDAAEPVTESCGESAPVSRRTVYQATGSLAVEAMENDMAEVHRAVAGALDAKRWDPIRTGDAQLGEAWADDTGIVVSAASEGSIVALTVFTPCYR